MKIYVISNNAFERWLMENMQNAANEEKSVSDLTDEEFVAICNKHHDGWHFDSLEEFVSAFNSDSPFAPGPSYHFIRVIEEKKA